MDTLERSYAKGSLRTENKSSGLPEESAAIDVAALQEEVGGGTAGSSLK